jgi:hypothetical protein
VAAARKERKNKAKTIFRGELRHRGLNLVIA